LIDDIAMSQDLTQEITKAISTTTKSETNGDEVRKVIFA